MYFSGFRFETATGRLWRDDDEVPLRPKTASVLGCLLARPGDVVSKRELVGAVWPDGFVGDAVLTGCIKELRRVLGDDPRHPGCIATAHKRGYRFVAPVSSRRQAPGETAQRWRPAFVGREAELALLDGWWRQAREGRRQVVFVAAPAGVGKTSLIDVFLDRLGDERPILVGRGQCVEWFGEGESYLPLLEALSGLGRGPHGHRVRDVLRAVAPTWLLQLPALHEPAELEMLRVQTIGASAARMLRELGDALDVITAERPLVLVCEDLHHGDQSTTEALAYVARRRDPARLLIVGTYRPPEVASRSHPVAQVVRDLRGRRQCGFLPLELLSRAAVADYLTARLAPRRPSDTLIVDLHQRTEGNALFVTTVVDYLIDRGLLDEASGQTRSRERLDRLGIPDRVGQFIEQQIDDLDARDCHLLEVAAAVGVDFAAEAVLAGARHDRPDMVAPEVEDRCSRLARNDGLLVEREVTEWPDGTITAQYSFHHGLYQEVLYKRLSPTRRAAIHRLIGERLASAHGSRASEIAAELAMHFELGRNYEQAIQFLAHAADTALQRVAHRETLDYASKGLQLLQRTEPTPERAALELRLRMRQVVALVTQQGLGAPGVDVAYQLARATCAEIDDATLLGPVLYGLRNFALAQGRLAEAAELTDELRELADRQPDPVLELQAHNAASLDHIVAGRPAVALVHAERGLELYDPALHARLALLYGTDPAVECHQWAAVATWLLGHPDRARHHAGEACRLARELGYPNDMFEASWCAVLVHVLCRDADQIRKNIDALFGVCDQYGLARVTAHAAIIDGWLAAQQGASASAIAQIREGLAEISVANDPFFSLLLAEALAGLGDTAAALEAASDALDSARLTGDLEYESELVRIRGELLLRIDPAAPDDSVSDAESALLEALAVARRQQAKSFELRAATSLARLWQSRGQHAQARSLLLETYGWFTEGHDTHDLKAAAAMLAELS